MRLETRIKERQQIISNDNISAIQEKWKGNKLDSSVYSSIINSSAPVSTHQQLARGREILFGLDAVFG